MEKFDASFFKALRISPEDTSGIAKIQNFMRDIVTMPDNEVEKLLLHRLNIAQNQAA
jgi:hypothetical protein